MYYFYTVPSRIILKARMIDTGNPEAAEMDSSLRPGTLWFSVKADQTQNMLEW